MLEQGSGDGTRSLSIAYIRIFYLNIPICVLCFVGTAQFLTLRTDRIPLAVKVRRIDWIGIVVFMASTTSLLFGITVGGTLYDWNSFGTLLPIILGAAGLVSFGVYEWFIPKEPMVPLKVFVSRTAMSAYFGTFFAWNGNTHHVSADPDSLEPQCILGILVPISSHSQSPWRGR